MPVHPELESLLNLQAKDQAVDDVKRALAALRPYRGGPNDEPVASLFSRIQRDIQPQVDIKSDEALDLLVDQGARQPELGDSVR